MLAPNMRALAAILMIITAFVVVSGCDGAYQVLESYVPTATPPAQSVVEIGSAVPASVVKDVTITGQGNTIIIRGRGPYNVGSHNDYFTLNKGIAEFSISLQGQGFGCAISLDYTNPSTGSGEYIAIHQFSSADRTYKLTKQVAVPYTCKYCLTVNWGGDWEIRITQ